MNQRLMTLPVMALLTSFVLGCGGDPGSGAPELGLVSGNVTKDGLPIPGAALLFSPAGGGRSSSATTDAVGDYQIAYNANSMGAAVGMHKVTVSIYQPMVGSPGEPGYVEENEQTMTLKFNGDDQPAFEVTSGENVIDLDLPLE